MLVADLTDIFTGEFQSRARKANHLRAPEPSQRGPDSITALVKYCEDPRTCRHVTICRYFGEKVDRSDADRLCQRFCDVCKDPKRTMSRYARLSSGQAVSSQSQRLFAEVDSEGIQEEPEQGEEPALPAPDDDETESAGRPAGSAEDVEMQEVAPSSSEAEDEDTPIVELPKTNVAPSEKSLGKRKAAATPAFSPDDDDDDLPDACKVAQSAAPKDVVRKPIAPAKDNDIFKKPALPVRPQPVAAAPARAAGTSRILREQCPCDRLALHRPEGDGSDRLRFQDAVLRRDEAQS